MSFKKECSQHAQRLFNVLLMAFCLSLTPLAMAVEPAFEPRAVKALQTMGEHLRSLKRFVITADSVTDQQLSDGQIIQRAHHIEANAQRPGRLHLRITDGLTFRSLVYNGSAYTLYDSRLNIFASEPASDSLETLLDQLANQLGSPLPLADLFNWDGSDAQVQLLLDAQYIGEEVLDNERCHHYAYRQMDIDWQLWIGVEEPLPCQLVIIRREDQNLPRHSIRYHWNAHDKNLVSGFDIQAPEGAKRISVPMFRQAILPNGSAQ